MHLQCISSLGSSLTAETIKPSSSDSSAYEINEELNILKVRFEELEKTNQELLMEKENLNSQLNDRSLVLGHQSASETNLVREEISQEYEENVCLMMIFLLISFP